METSSDFPASLTAPPEAPLAPTSISLEKDYGADLDLLMSLVPDRMGFKIGEVSEMLGLKNYILRYWETEFNELRPKKSHNNQRMYTRREIETLLLIRKFLYVDKFSISGARKALRDWTRGKHEKKTLVKKEQLTVLRGDLYDLLESIKALKAGF